MLPGQKQITKEQKTSRLYDVLAMINNGVSKSNIVTILSESEESRQKKREAAKLAGKPEPQFLSWTVSRRQAWRYINDLKLYFASQIDELVKKQEFGKFISRHEFLYAQAVKTGDFRLARRINMDLAEVMKFGTDEVGKSVGTLAEFVDYVRVASSTKDGEISINQQGQLEGFVVRDPELTQSEKQ